MKNKSAQGAAAYLIFPNQKSSLCVVPANGTDFSLEEMQSAVGGFIQTIELKDGRIMVIHEEGKLENLPMNKTATALLHDAGGMLTDWIAGNALVCNPDQIK